MADQHRALSGVRSDYIVSTLASVSVACSSIVLFAWIGRALSPDDLGFFSQIRRVSAMWVPVSTLGVSLALSRYLPRLQDLRMIRRRTLQLSGIVAAMLALHVGVLSAGWSAPFLAPVIGERMSLVWPFVFQLLGLSVLVVPYAALRGLHRIRLAAGLQVTGYALWPLVCLAYEPGAALEALVLRIGVGQSLIGVTSLALIAGVVRPLRQPAEPVQADRLGALLAYGLARLPGGIFAFILWAGVPMALLRVGLPTEAALANAVTSLVNLPVMVLSPLSFVLLPRLSLAQVQREDDEVRTFVRNGLRTAWDLQLPVTLGLVAFIEPIVQVWLGFGAGGFVGSARWMVLAIPAVTLFQFCRPTVDARAVVPYAVIAQGIGAIAGLIGWLVMDASTLRQSIGQAFFMGQSVAAVALILWCYRVHEMKFVLANVSRLLPALPLIAGTVVVVVAGLQGWSVVAFALALFAYLAALVWVDSPVAQGLRALRRGGRS